LDFSDLTAPTAKKEEKRKYEETMFSVIANSISLNFLTKCSQIIDFG